MAVAERIPVSGLYTVAEAAYVSGMDPKSINNEFDRGAFMSRSADRLVPKPSLYYLAAVRPHWSEMEVSLRRSFHESILDAYQGKRPFAKLDHFLVEIQELEAELKPRFDLVDRLRDGIKVTPGVAGGEAVIAGTRIKPRHVADMVTAGASAAEIMSEHDLTADQISLAVLFDKLYPRRGRPAGQRLNRKTHALFA